MSKNIYPFLAIVVIIVLGLGAIFLLSNQHTKTPGINIATTPLPTAGVTMIPTPTPEASGGAAMNNMKTFPDGLQIEDEVVGTGAEAKTGDTVTVNYVGTLTNGTKFDSSYDRNQPFTTQIGVGQVIKGWDEGIVGMKVGGKRKLIIPPSLGYGSQAVGGIPSNSTLIFEVELLNVK